MFKGVRLILIGLCALISNTAFAVSFPQQSTTWSLCSTNSGRPSGFNNNYHGYASASSACSAVSKSVASTPYLGTHPCSGSSSVYRSTCTPRGDYTINVFSNATCPTNSTLTSGTCSPNTGYSAVNNNGSWSVVPTGSECQNGQVYNSTSGVCETPVVPASCGTLSNPSADPKCTCETENEPYKYVVTNLGSVQGYRCSAGSNEETKLVGVLASALGLNTALATGLATSIGACITGVLCLSALALSLIGAVTTAVGFALDADPSSTINPSAPIQAVITPAGAETPQPENNKFKIGGFGEIVPPLNATQDPQQSSVWKLTVGSQTVAVNRDTNTATITDTTSPTETITITSSGSSSPMFTKTTSSNFGTSTAGKPVTQIKTTRSPLPRDSSITSQQATTVTSYFDGDDIYEQPPSMGSCVGDGCTVADGGNTGGGTGGTGSGDCAQYGCAREATQLQVLASLTSSPPVSVQNQANQQAQTMFDQLVTAENELVGNMTNSINNFLDNSGIDEIFEGWGAFNPFADITNTSCSITSQWFGNRTLSYCDEQPTIHRLMAWMFFVFFSLRIFSLVTDSKGYDRAMF